MRPARVQRVIRALRPRGTPRDVVLMYHRVRSAVHDPLELNVSPANFAAHMEVLVSSGMPVVPLEALLEPANHQRLAITFDDGYVDNFEVAAPMLRTHGFPASFFVTTGALEACSTEFWWDRLEHVFFAGPMAVTQLHVEGRKGPTSLDVSTEDSRSEAYKVCNEAVATAPPAQIERFLSHLVNQVCGVLQQCDDHERIGREQLADLAGDELVHIGAHTRDHAVLAALDDAAAFSQIAQGRTGLAEVLGREPTTMAYPFGGRGAVHRRHESMAREVGFRLACVTQPDTHRAGKNPFAIPRFHVANLDAGRFERVLVGFASR